MPIEFRCSGCGKLLRTPDESAGQKARCPGCGTIVGIPAASTATAEPIADTTQANANPFQDNAGASANAARGSVGAGPSPGGYGTGSSGAGGYGTGSYGTGSYGTGGYGAGGEPRGANMPNPYAAPMLAPPPQAAPTGEPLRHCSITMEQLLRTTWEVLREQFWMAVLLGLILMAMGFVSGIITTPINLAAQATQDIRLVIGGQILGQFLAVFVQVFIQLGGTYTILRWARNGSIDIADVFKVGPYYLRGLGLTLLIQLITFGVIAICLIPLAASLPFKNQEATIICGIVGALVALPIVVWISLSFYLAMAFLVDRNTTIGEAMSLSRAYMAGNKLTVFVASMIFGLVALVSVVCTCGLAALPLTPAATLFMVLIYLMTTGQQIYAPRAPGSPSYPPQAYAPPPNPQDPANRNPPNPLS
jgi:phage FluMu protein Com